MFLRIQALCVLGKYSAFDYITGLCLGGAHTTQFRPASNMSVSSSTSPLLVILMYTARLALKLFLMFYLT